MCDHVLAPLKPLAPHPFGPLETKAEEEEEALRAATPYLADVNYALKVTVGHLQRRLCGCNCQLNKSLDSCRRCCSYHHLVLEILTCRHSAQLSYAIALPKPLLLLLSTSLMLSVMVLCNQGANSAKPGNACPALMTLQLSFDPHAVCETGRH